MIRRGKRENAFVRELLFEIQGVAAGLSLESLFAGLGGVFGHYGRGTRSANRVEWLVGDVHVSDQQADVLEHFKTSALFRGGKLASLVHSESWSTADTADNLGALPPLRRETAQRGDALSSTSSMSCVPSPKSGGASWHARDRPCGSFESTSSSRTAHPTESYLTRNYDFPCRHFGPVIDLTGDTRINRLNEPVSRFSREEVIDDLHFDVVHVKLVYE